MFLFDYILFLTGPGEPNKNGWALPVWWLMPKICFFAYEFFQYFTNHGEHFWILYFWHWFRKFLYQYALWLSVCLTLSSSSTRTPAQQVRSPVLPLLWFVPGNTWRLQVVSATKSTTNAMLLHPLMLLLWRLQPKAHQLLLPSLSLNPSNVVLSFAIHLQLPRFAMNPFAQVQRSYLFILNRSNEKSLYSWKIPRSTSLRCNENIAELIRNLLWFIFVAYVGTDGEATTSRW